MVVCPHCKKRISNATLAQMRLLKTAQCNVCKLMMKRVITR